MECRKARWLLNPFLEGELEGPRAWEMEAHLDSCPTCHAEFEGLKRSLALLEGLPSLSPPPGFASRVMAAVLQHGTAYEPARGNALGWIMAAVLGGVGALLVYGYLGEQGWPWDPSTMEALGSQPVGLGDLASLLLNVEVGAIVGVTLLFVAMTTMFLQLLQKEQRCQHG